MIIEDEQDLLNLYKDFLINKGYHISVTNTTASNVLGDYEEFEPDLVIWITNFQMVKTDLKRQMRFLESIHMRPF